jgi:choline-sulfatase
LAASCRRGGSRDAQAPSAGSAEAPGVAFVLSGASERAAGERASGTASFAACSEAVRLSSYTDRVNRQETWLPLRAPWSRSPPRALALAIVMVLAGAIGCRGPQPEAASGNGSGGGGAAASASVPVPAKAVLLVTIDTLRADRIGAYGWRAARTPAIDALAARGVRVDRAYATAPITLTSHASLLTGLYPPKHGARHNGMRVRADVPTLAGMLHARGFATGAFVAAFPLDRRFGLDRGFDVYSDALPRGADGRPRNERPGREVVDEALGWLARRDASAPFFLWVHLFEPHAPYEGDPALGAANATRPVSDRYDDEIARADAQVARLVQALGPRADTTLVIIAGDHGEAFGEHGEIGHSLFIYDTTLHVPLVLAGAPVTTRARGAQAQVITEPVSLVDVLPTILDLTGLPAAPGDGTSLVPAFANGPCSAGSGGGSGSASSASDPKCAGGALGARTLYAESFAPLFDFGWSPLRSLRLLDIKYVAAPKPELYDLTHDAGETHNTLAEHPDSAKSMAQRIDQAYPIDLAPAGTVVAAKTATAADAASAAATGAGASKTGAASAAGARAAAGAGAAAVTDARGAGADAAAASAADRETLARLRSLGYLASSSSSASASNRPATGSSSATGNARAAATAAMARPDPKDRVELASRIAEVTSGELEGAALRSALERLVRDDPRNGQMQMRLGFVLQEAGECAAAMPHFNAAIAAAVPSAEPQLGLAECLGAAGQHDAARRALLAADRIEPGNPIVAANLGMMALDEGKVPDAIARLRAALARAPDLHQARFALARAYGRAGQRADAAREARELLTRLPPDAPQRPEVERLLAAVQ